MRKTITWLGVIGSFESIARVFIFLARHNYCLYIIFVFYLTNKRNSVDELVKCALQNPLGPGFESQVPQNFVTFFLQVLRCSASGREHHIPPDLMCQVVPDPDPVVQDEVHHEPWSTNVQAI